MQPGPIYFKVPRRCQVFGVHAEGIGRQMNYLIDESVICGKGANAAISMLHHILENFGFGEKNLELTADNCAGQNKNAYLMWYIIWRLANGLHKKASISFMLAGHTMFAPDWCFGLFKRQYRRTFVSSLKEIELVTSIHYLNENMNNLKIQFLYHCDFNVKAIFLLNPALSIRVPRCQKLQMFCNYSE